MRTLKHITVRSQRAEDGRFTALVTTTRGPGESSTYCLAERYPTEEAALQAARVRAMRPQARFK